MIPRSYEFVAKRTQLYVLASPYISFSLSKGASTLSVVLMPRTPTDSNELVDQITALIEGGLPGKPGGPLYSALSSLVIGRSNKDSILRGPEDAAGIVRALQRRWTLTAQEDKETYHIGMLVELMLDYFETVEEADAAGLISLVMLIAAFGTTREKGPLYTWTFTDSQRKKSAFRKAIARILAPCETEESLIVIAFKGLRQLDDRPWMRELLPIFERRLGTNLFERIAIETMYFVGDWRGGLLESILPQPRSSFGRFVVEKLREGLNRWDVWAEALEREKSAGKER
jgi:hypothetical protein